MLLCNTVVFTKYLKEILESEISHNTQWSLYQRMNFVQQKLRVDNLADQTLSEHTAKEKLQQSKSRSTASCYRCGKEGHFAADCRSTTRFRLHERKVSTSKSQRDSPYRRNPISTASASRHSSEHRRSDGWSRPAKLSGSQSKNSIESRQSQSRPKMSTFCFNSC